MYHSSIELQAIADAHQEELRNECHANTSTRATPRLIASIRRNVGLALISAGEAIADRRPAGSRSNLRPAAARSIPRAIN